MKIIALDTSDSARWNDFIVKHFPPVGAFLQSWEWGSFKQQLHGTVKRYAVTDGKEWLACMQMEIHQLPFGFSYGYVPRGPVLRSDLWNTEQKVADVFACITEYLKQEFPKFIFLRFEPPHKTHFKSYDQAPYAWPSYYVQPRFNQLITLMDPEALMKTLSRDIKHDIRAGEHSGVTVECKNSLTPEEDQAFEKMKDDTRTRSQKNIYPSETYFKHFLETFSAPPDTAVRPYLRYFVASREGVPVAIHLNLFFANTLTYLYGASYSGSRSKRAPAYLHWKSMQIARDEGYTYYDLGGVDDSFWHGLTYFKRQFGGETYEYVGTFDAVIRPDLYHIYAFVKNLRKSFC